VVQGARFPLASEVMQARPLQQDSSEVQTKLSETQLAGVRHTPPVHVSVALQQGTVPEQLWVVSAHTDAASHVP